MRKTLTTALLATALLGLTAPAWAENPLDEALGPKDAKVEPKAAPAKAEPAKADPAAHAEPADPKKTNASDQLISPDAANAVDTEDLVKKLTGQEKEAPGAEKMLQEILDRMQTSAQRLHDKDPGQVTQETQRRIVLNLDTLIELAKQQQQNPQPNPDQKPGDKRERNPGQQPEGSGAQPSDSQGGNQAAAQSNLRGGNPSAAASNGADIRERGKEWGNLPDRDRDLIAKYSQEKTVPAYEDAVRKYYQALAEISKNREK